MVKFTATLPLYADVWVKTTKSAYLKEPNETKRSRVYNYSMSCYRGRYEYYLYNGQQPNPRINRLTRLLRKQKVRYYTYENDETITITTIERTNHDI